MFDCLFGRLSGWVVCLFDFRNAICLCWLALARPWVGEDEDPRGVNEDPRGVNVQELLNKHAKTSYNGLCNVVNMGQPHRKRYLDTVCLLRTCELLDPMSGGACI